MKVCKAAPDYSRIEPRAFSSYSANAFTLKMETFPRNRQQGELMELSKKQIKQLAARAKMQKARVHIGLYGLQPNTLEAFVRAFDGICIRPEPCDVVRVKVHSTFTGDFQRLIDDLCSACHCIFVKQEGEFLVFWKPSE